MFIYSRVYEIMQKYLTIKFLQATLNTALVVQKSLGFLNVIWVHKNQCVFLITVEHLL